MLKKLVVVGVVGFVAVAALKGSKIESFIRSEVASIGSRVDASISPERELARIKNEVRLLDKDLVPLIDQVARERVEVKGLTLQVAEVQARQSQDKELLEARAAAIKAATERVTFGTRTLPVTTAKAELEEGVKRYTTNQKALESLEATLASRTRVRDNLEKQLEALKTQKAELTAAVSALESEVAALKLQQMESKYQTDDSRLGKIKEDMRALRKKMEVEREKLKLMPAVLDESPTPAAAGRSVEDIMAPLAPAKPATPKTEKMPQAD